MILKKRWILLDENTDTTGSTTTNGSDSGSSAGEQPDQSQSSSGSDSGSAGEQPDQSQSSSGSDSGSATSGGTTESLMNNINDLLNSKIGRVIRDTQEIIESGSSGSSSGTNITIDDEIKEDSNNPVANFAIYQVISSISSRVSSLEDSSSSSGDALTTVFNYSNSLGTAKEYSYDGWIENKDKEYGRLSVICGIGKIGQSITLPWSMSFNNAYSQKESDCSKYVILISPMLESYDSTTVTTTVIPLKRQDQDPTQGGNRGIHFYVSEQTSTYFKVNMWDDMTIMDTLTSDNVYFTYCVIGNKDAI